MHSSLRILLSTHTLTCSLVFLYATILTPSVVKSQDVSVQLSTRETYVGSPVVLQIQISNANDYSLPDAFKIDGCDVLASDPSTSSQVMIYNGRRSESRSVSIRYLITPRRAGKFRIPELQISVDGKNTLTKSAEFVATKSETGDLLFVEIVGKKPKVYVGQPLDLTLKIWIKPYKDKATNIKLSEANMWQMISQNTSWGSFESTLQNLSNQRQRPGGKPVIRDDGSGTENEYYLFEIDTTVYPTKPGRIDADEVQIVVDYPEKLGRSRDPFDSLLDGGRLGGSSLMKRMMDDDFFGGSPFGRRMTISKSRPIAANATVNSTEVLPIPLEGRPADYRGAVGSYSILAEAEPKTVDAGDPITLRLGIIGDGPMDLIQAPPLSEVSSLIDDFKVTDQSLAGFVQDDTKVFVTTVRPRTADITQIPPIPFSFFDPEAESYKTVYSKAIPISVSEAETLALDSIVGNAGGKARGEDEAETLAALPKFENDFSMSVLASHPSPGKTTWRIWILAPFLLWLLALLFKAGYLATAWFASFKSIRDRAIAKLNVASTPSEISAAIVEQIQGYGKQTFQSSQHAIGWLRSSGLTQEARTIESFLIQLDRENESTGHASEIKEEIFERAKQLTDLLDDSYSELGKRKVFSSKQKQHLSLKKSTITMLLLAFVCSKAIAEQPSTDNQLSVDQQKEILTEANHLYSDGVAQMSTDAAESVDLFSDAARKYRMLVDNGLQNEKIYMNLGNALWRSNQKGKAIASYRNALKCNPASNPARIALAYCRANVSAGPEEASSSHAKLSRNPWLRLPLQIFGTGPMVTLLAVSSICFWMLAGAKLFYERLPFCRLALLPFFLATISGISLWVNERIESPLAIAVVDSLNLRAGDGNEFPSVAVLKSVTGKEFRFLNQRSNWILISANDQQTGWVPATDVELVVGQ